MGESATLNKLASCGVREVKWRGSEDFLLLKSYNVISALISSLETRTVSLGISFNGA